MDEKHLIGLVYTPRVADSREFLSSLVEPLGIRDRHWIVAANELDSDRREMASTSTIIAAGGDGTILRVARVSAQFGVPIVGVNMGRVGFMTELTPDDAARRLPGYLGGEARVEERMMLQATVTAKAGAPGEPVHALNDVVVTRGAKARILDIDATVDGMRLNTYRADGLIVATATGSTGYSLSAGGPILSPEVRALILQPVAAHMGLHSGLVLDSGSVIELTARGETDVILSFDGYIDWSLDPDDRVTISRSPHVARFLRDRPPAGFYTNLFDRLGVKEYPDRPGQER